MLLVITGTALVLLTWALGVFVVACLGLVPAQLTSPRSANRAVIMRRALWWGLAVAGVITSLANLAVPLHSAGAAIALLGLAVVLGIPGWRLLRRRARVPVGKGGWPRMLLWCALALALVFLAYSALGPVTNYDSGLYHLGAIRYSAEQAAIPGLANLYGPLGYGTAAFPLAALLGNGPWQGEGFRLLNGLLMTLVTADLVLRMRVRRPGPGAVVLGIGVLAAGIPLIALSDYWVTSPTQDAAVLILTIAASAAVVDAVHGRRGWVAEGALALALGVLIVSIRPTMLAFLAAALVLIVVLIWRRRPPRPTRTIGVVAVLAVFTGIAGAARDAVLSGWVAYPLSVMRLDVPWAAPDPATLRLATLGFHRDPTNFQSAITGWSWVGPWMTSRVTQWETYALGALGAAALIVCVVAARTVTLQWRRMGLAMIPSAAAVIVWWALTPPSYRFGWGPLFTLGAIPLGWALWRLVAGQDRDSMAARRWAKITAAGIAIPLIVVTLFTAVVRTDPGEISTERTWTLGVSIPYAVAAIPPTPVDRFRADDGLMLLVPNRSDQCWEQYPLCTPEPRASLRLRGETLQQGLLP